MKRTFKRILKVVGIVVVVALLGGGAWAGYQVHAFNSSMARRYELPLGPIARSSDPAVLERGKHIAESIGACSSKDCHGGDFSGGEPIRWGRSGPCKHRTSPRAGAAASTRMRSSRACSFTA